MLRNGILTSLGILSVVILGLLIQRTRIVDTEAHDEYHHAVSELRSISSDLVDEVENAREGDLADHADIDSAFAQSRSMFARARAIPGFVRAPATDSLELLLRGYEQSTEHRERLAAEFKRINVLLQAALDSAKRHVKRSVEGVWALEADPARALQLHVLGNRWLEETLDGGSRAQREMDSAYAGLRAHAAQLTPGGRAIVESLLADFGRIRPLAFRADSLSDAIDDAPLSDNPVAMRELYDAEFEHATTVAGHAEQLLAIYAGLLLSIVLLVGYRLQRSRTALNAANDALETKVLERTAALERVNQELERTRDEALQATVAKSQFLATMSHELRTPLNSVIGFTNILLKNKRGVLIAQELGFLTRIVENGRHLLTLINDILDLSKIEAGKVDLEVSAIRVDELVLETVRQFGSDPKGNGVTLRALVPESTPWVMADAGRLKQILINLVGNALKFTEQGSVTVALRLDEKTGRADRIEVIDSGIGIAPDRLGAIFEAFQQADTSTSRRFGGTGLGLAISNSLAQLMGCRIEANSVYGEGSVFTIVLPATAPCVHAPIVASDSSGSDVAHSSVGELLLVIDDDADSRLLMTQLLQDAGYEVLAANSGSQGLRMAREFNPRAILLDLMMPGMSGFDVLKELKQTPATSSIPVIVVSMVAKDYAGSLLGAVDLVEKPLARETLLAAIQRNLHRPVKRILVVDDDQDTRRLITSYLADDAVLVETAANGFEALAVMARFAPDALVIDLMMPGMGGAECVKTIRRDARYLNIPIVVVTAKDLSGEELGRLKAMSTEVLKKGEELERDLKLTIESHLSKRPSLVELVA